MKRLIFLVLLFLPVVAPAQNVRDYLTRENFEDTVSASWLFVPTDSSFTVVQSSTAADTFETGKLYTQFGGGEIWLTWRLVKVVSGTANTKIEVGLFRGAGTKTAGWEWQTLGTLTAPGESDYILKNYSWAADKPFSAYKFRITETGAQQNQYVLNVHHFRQR